MKKILTLLTMVVTAGSILPIYNFNQTILNFGINKFQENSDPMMPKFFINPQFEKIEGFGDNSAVTSKGVIFVSADMGLYISIDNGFTFTENINFINKVITALYVDTNDNLYLICNNFLYKSSDSGETFTVLNKISSINDLITNLVVYQNKVYLGVFGQGVFVSNDNGKTFENILSITTGIHQILIKDGVIAVASDLGCYISSDFKNFISIPNLSSFMVHNVFFDKSDNLYIAASSVISNFSKFIMVKKGEYSKPVVLKTFNSFEINNIIFSQNVFLVGKDTSDGNSIKTYELDASNWSVLKMWRNPYTSSSNFVTSSVSNKNITYIFSSVFCYFFNTPYLLLNSISAPYTYDSSKNQFDLKGSNNLSVNWNMLDMVSVNGQMVDNTQTSIKLSKGENHLTLILNDVYSKYANIFGVDGGEIEYTFFVS